MAKEKNANPDELEAVPPTNRPVIDPNVEDQANTQPQAVSDQKRSELAKAASRSSAASATAHATHIAIPGARTSDPAALVRNPIDPSDSNLTTLLKLTGYKKEDLSGYNTGSRTIATTNGGKYQLKKSGRSFRRISGPLAPAERQEQEDEE